MTSAARNGSSLCPFLCLQFATNAPQHFRMSPNLSPINDRFEVLLLIGLPGKHNRR